MLFFCFRKFDEIVAEHQLKVKPVSQEHADMLAKRGIKRSLPFSSTNGSSSSSSSSRKDVIVPKKKKGRSSMTGNEPEKEPVAVKTQGMADLLQRQLELDERKAEVGQIYFGSGT